MMGQGSNNAAVMDVDVKIKQSRKELALSMRQRLTDAAAKDALIKLGREEFVLCTENTATPLKGGEGWSVY